jgi:hypothetical protein
MLVLFVGPTNGDPVAEADMTNGVPGTIRSPFSGAVTETLCAPSDKGQAKVAAIIKALAAKKRG